MGTILLKIGKHIENLSVHAKLMQEKNYKALHYQSEGTDLVVGLPKGHIWEDATSYVNGNQQAFIANLPTEEVLQLLIVTTLMDM